MGEPRLVSAADLMPGVMAMMTKDPAERERLLRQAYPTYEDAIAKVAENLYYGERSYRRGYHHCLVYLSPKLASKLSPIMQEWLSEYEGKIEDWRYQPGRLRQDPPPGHYGA